ncbi:hypothetical protein HP456_13080 [Bacillus haikouensis]|jgi:type II secretory pathway component HofQ|uniref:hypothetical protein n=1 Tax=Bacillus haikouensis TaxID=1510468 RepID=UPI001555D2A1|nr:hypothetical protein [Bacillus haikouensis]NQD66845.1 hypothetical protein [Bacillus haikouensis]
MEGLIVAVIIGLLTTIFNRSKDSSSEENRSKPKPIVTGSPVETNREEPRRKRQDRRVYPDAEQEEPVYTLQTKFEEQKQDIENKYAQLKKQREGNKQEAQMQRTRVKSIKEKDPSQYSIDFESEDDIVKGFIFSEVFGPPRAKKPHHRK